jgi:hypothetical protein
MSTNDDFCGSCEPDGIRRETPRVEGERSQVRSVIVRVRAATFSPLPGHAPSQSDERREARRSVHVERVLSVNVGGEIPSAQRRWRVNDGQ